MPSDEDAILACATYIWMELASRRNNRKHRRRVWISSPFQNRSLSVATDFLYNLSEKDFTSCCMMPPAVFNELLEMLTPKIQKQNTNYRNAIPSSDMLAVTLNYLATGNSYESLGSIFKISPSSISCIVPEVCAAIIDVLQDYMKTPDSEEEWLKVAEGFKENWNFPHCIGAMDCKYILTQVPNESESTSTDDNKSNFYIVILVVVDADYNFLYTYVGTEECIPDTHVFKRCDFYKKLKKKNGLNMPRTKFLPGRQKIMPYVFIVGDAFRLTPNCIKSYPPNDNDYVINAYNYHVSKVKRVVQNVFGVMSTVFQVLSKSILLEPKKAETVIKACLYLHNYLRKNQSSRNVYSPNGTFDREVNGEVIGGSWRRQFKETSLQRFRPFRRKESQLAEKVRTEFGNYFALNGGDPWQYDEEDQCDEIVYTNKDLYI